MKPLIETRELSRSFRTPVTTGGLWNSLKGLVHRNYRTINAVSGLDFSINPGEAIGFIGPNGAGKSTTVKMLTGILTPSAGSLSVMGLTPHQNRRELTQHIGVVFGQRTQLWWDLPVIESFGLLSHIYHVPRATYKARLEELTALLDLESFLDVPVRKLSLGQRMRSDLAASLLHDPPILFLDEPTIGLDVSAKDAIRKFLRKLVREENKTLLLTTHDLSDIEIICPRLMIIDHGQLLFDGSLEDLRRRFLNKVRVIIDADDTSVITKTLPQLAQYQHHDEGRFVIDLPRDVMSPADFLSHVIRETTLKEVKIEEPEIEDVVREIYQKGSLE